MYFDINAAYNFEPLDNYYQDYDYVHCKYDYYDDKNDEYDLF